MRTVKILLKDSRWDEPRWRRVRVVARRAGLAITPLIGLNDRPVRGRWNVTSEVTGMRVINDCFLSLREARRALREFAPITDWAAMTEERAKKSRGVGAAVRKVFAAIEADRV